MSSVDDLSKAFQELAELSEIKGEVRFKVNAYQRAAELVRSLGDEILRKDELKELRSYRGIGEGIAKKILEFKNTGSISKLEELKEEVPLELISLLQVPNLGPKRAKMLYDELGIRSIGELQEAAEDHRLAELKGLGPKVESNILEGIRHLEVTSGRLLLHEAHSIQEDISACMREKIPGLDISPAGSLRRMKETIGDIDLLVSSRDAAAVMETFCLLPMVNKVLVRGDTKSSILNTKGLQVDLRVVLPKEYGAALQYFTGSQAHNVRVREVAKKAGLKINEYGVFLVKNNRRMAGATEEEVYEALGMACPPPELRENHGEVEAAMRGDLPSLIERGDIRGDLHVHSEASDGMASLEELREAAAARGYDYLAVTDHAGDLKVAGGLSEEALLEQVEAIASLNSRKGSKVTMLAGSELNIDKQGGLDYDDDVLARLDFCIASIHSGFKQSRSRITGRIIEAMRHPRVKIIGHPTGRLIGQRPPYEVDMHAVMQAAVETDTALELNSFPERLDLGDGHLMEAREMGVKIAIGTDAHLLPHLDYMFYGVATARRGWLEPGTVLNTLHTKQLKAWLRQEHSRR